MRKVSINTTIRSLFCIVIISLLAIMGCKPTEMKTRYRGFYIGNARRSIENSSPTPPYVVSFIQDRQIDFFFGSIKDGEIEESKVFSLTGVDGDTAITFSRNGKYVDIWTLSGHYQCDTKTLEYYPCGTGINSSIEYTPIVYYELLIDYHATPGDIRDKIPLSNLGRDVNSLLELASKIKADIIYIRAELPVQTNAKRKNPVIEE